MTDKTASRKLRIIHPFLFGIYPIIFLYSRNVGEVFYESIIIPTAIAIAFTFIAMFLLSRLIKGRNKLGIILTGFWFYFFGYGNVHGSLDELTIGSKLIGTNSYLIPAWTAVFLLAAILVLVFPKNLSKITRILNVMAVSLVVLCVTTIAFEYVKHISREKKIAVIEHAAGFPDPSNMPSELPNIYYIVLDQRVRSDILKEFFGYDDSIFLGQLAERGFYVADKSYSNYAQTKLSLSSTLHCTYYDELIEIYRTKPIKGSMSNAIFHTNRVFEILRKFGYTMVSFASGFKLTEIRDVDVRYSVRPSSGLLLDEYTNELINNTIITDVFSLVFKDISGRLTLKAHRDGILYAFEKLGETATLPSPHFVFTHIVSPHMPYVFDENGIIDRPDKPFIWGKTNLTRGQRDQKYIAQLKFINKKTIEAIDSILANSKKPPVIILQADHGTQWKFGPEGKTQDFRTYFGILNAYHLPGDGDSKLYESISPVNTFRVIFNRYFGANLELLEDRSYYSSYKQPFDFTEKTEDIK